MILPRFSVLPGLTVDLLSLHLPAQGEIVLLIDRSGIDVIDGFFFLLAAERVNP